MPKTPVWLIAFLVTFTGLLWPGACAHASPVASEPACPDGAGGSPQVELAVWGMMNSWAGVSSAPIDFTSPSASAELPASAFPETTSLQDGTQLSSPRPPNVMGRALGGASAPTNLGSSPSVISISAATSALVGVDYPAWVRYLGCTNLLFLPDPYLLALFRPPRAC